MMQPSGDQLDLRQLENGIEDRRPLLAPPPQGTSDGPRNSAGSGDWGRLNVKSCRFCVGRVEYLTRIAAMILALATTGIYGYVAIVSLLYFPNIALLVLTIVPSLCSIIVILWEIVSMIVNCCSIGRVKLNEQLCFHYTDGVFHGFMAVVFGGIAIYIDSSNQYSWFITLTAVITNLLAVVMWLRLLWAILTVVTIKNRKWVQADDPAPELEPQIPDTQATDGPY